MNEEINNAQSETSEHVNEATENVEILTPEIINSENQSTDFTENNKTVKFDTKKIIILCVVIIVLFSAILGGIKFKQHKDNINAANNVINMINNIGEISATDEVGKKINTASSAYAALTDTQKSYVSNLDILTNAVESYGIKIAEVRMKLLASSLKSNANLCQAFFSDYSRVWYNAIYHKTDEYNNGDFSDFNKALLAFQQSDTYKNGIDSLNKLNKMITETWTSIKDTSINTTGEFNALKEVYTAYLPMYALATNPEGSYNSYTAEVIRLNTAYKTAYTSLAVIMPEINTLDEN